MGTATSNLNSNIEEDLWWRNGAPTKDPNINQVNSNKENESILDDCVAATVSSSVGNINEIVNGYSRSLDSREKLDLFKKHLETKRVERQTIIKQKKFEMNQLRLDLEKEKQTNQLLRDKIDRLSSNSTQMDNLTKMDEILNENIELKKQIVQLHHELEQINDLSEKNKRLQIEQATLQNELQSLNKQIIDYEQQKEEFQKHIAALKDIIKISKQMILLREGELNELKQKVQSIEKLLADHEMNTMSNDLRKEYERQLRNIRNLRTLYEERARIGRIELQNIKDQLTDVQQKFEFENKKNSELQERIDELEEDTSKKFDDICSLESDLGLSKAECCELKQEMSVINQLFAQFLLGFNTTQSQDLDKLIKTLEENHDLLTDINTKEENTSAAFPRLILNVINQIGERKHSEINQEIDDQTTNSSNQNQTTTSNVEEIIANLPKVWRVLTELLSHQTVHPVEINANSSDNNLTAQDDSNPCCKSIETPSGTRYELSVSKTYIRLKDLILEKKYLQKEMLKMKTLNTHLEERLQNQETRLLLVTKELNKTWHIVGRLQRQHEQLHTHEKILRYELSQKRKLLNELKDELEYCKDKWEQAREKNTESEHECSRLRSEFASRRCQTLIDDFNNSAESGYSDEQEEMDDDDETDDELINIICQSNDKQTQPIVETINENIDPCVNTVESSVDSNFQEETQPIEELHCDNIDAPDNMNESSTDSMYPQIDTSIDNRDQTIVNKSTDINYEIKNEETEDFNNKSPIAAAEEFVKRREERFKRLEQHCEQLKQTYMNQTERGTELCTKLDHIHEQFSGNSSTNNQSTKQELQDTEIINSDQLQETGTDCIKDKNEVLSNDCEASTSTMSNSSREERFKRMEEQCKQLKEKYANQTKRGTEICSKLDSIHEEQTSSTETNNENSLKE